MYGTYLASVTNSDQFLLRPFYAMNICIATGPHMTLCLRILFLENSKCLLWECFPFIIITYSMTGKTSLYWQLEPTFTHNWSPTKHEIFMCTSMTSSWSCENYGSSNHRKPIRLPMAFRLFREVYVSLCDCFAWSKLLYTRGRIMKQVSIAPGLSKTSRSTN